MFPVLTSFLCVISFSLVRCANADRIHHVRRDLGTGGGVGQYTNSSKAAVTTTSSASPSWTYVNLCSPIFGPRTGGRQRVTSSVCKNSCAATWNQYFSSLEDASIHAFGYVSYQSTYTYHNMTAQITTACDGHPRIVGDLTTTATGIGTVLTSMTTNGNFSGTRPSCTLAPSECVSFIVEYGSTMVSSYCTNTKAADCGKCTINAGTV